METVPRLIILGTGAADKFYVGKTGKTPAEILDDMKNGVAIPLDDCRLLLHLVMGAMTHQGPTASIQMRMLPLPLCNSGANVAIKASFYMEPEGVPPAGVPPAEGSVLLANLEEMIKESLKLEGDMRVRRSGLAPVGLAPVGLVQPVQRMPFGRG
jgi:hypothetical protein